MKTKTLILLVMLTMNSIVLGCSGPQLAKSGGIQLEPQPAAPLAPAPPPEPGSLWTTRASEGFLTDHRARNVGDIVTILVAETSSSGTTASTTTGKTMSSKLGILSLLGLSQTFNSFQDQNAPADNAGNLIYATGDFSNKGAGNTARNNSFNASIPAQVVQVLPNNNLVVRGTRNIKVNNENQIMAITGIVRPKDINRDNQVSSTQLAEAKMEITGVGVVADKQKVGWLSRIIDAIWPF